MPAANAIPNVVATPPRVLPSSLGVLRKLSYPVVRVGGMSVVELPAPPPSGPAPQEVAWRFAEGEAVAVMGTVNVAVARLVAAVRVLLDTDGWEGVGIQSPEHWLCWKAGVARPRAEGLVAIARRVAELPACWALFTAGRLGEDSMVRIARRVPPPVTPRSRRWRPPLLIAQLDRLLRSLPEQPDGSDRPRHPSRSGCCACATATTAGCGASSACPPMRARCSAWGSRRAVTPSSATATTSTRRRDRRPRRPRPGRGGPPGDLGRRAGAHGLRAADALDPTFRRTGQRGERNTVVIHHDVDPHGTLGPGQLELGPVVPDPVARYLACDATVQVVTYRLGQIIGIHPTERTPNRATRRYLARRDQGCTHPLCTQTLWLHAHHIVHWEHGGPTVPESRAVVPLPPPGPPPRRLLDRRRPRSRHPPLPRPLRPPHRTPTPRPATRHRPTRRRPTPALHPTPRRTAHRRHLRLELTPVPTPRPCRPTARDGLVELSLRFSAGGRADVHAIRRGLQRATCACGTVWCRRRAGRTGGERNGGADRVRGC